MEMKGDLHMCENQEKYQYVDEAPYPPVQVCGRNQDYAIAILGNIGACNSEMSAIALYFYNSIILGESYEEVGRIFHKISMVEMHHLNIFGRLSEMLGAEPRLWSVNRGRFTYWTPKCNNYPRKIDSLLKNAYKGELDAIDKYTKQLSWIEDEHIRANLERIILDEKCHLKIFESLYEKYCE